MTSNPLHGDAPAHGTVLWLTRDPILALDVGQAFQAAGINAVNAPDRLEQYSVLVIDADGLDRKSRAIVRRHRINHVKMIVLADTRKIASALGGPDAIWITKPVSSEDLVDRLLTLVSPAGPSGEDGGAGACSAASLPD